MVENFKTGGLVKYGLDGVSLRALRPRLIYCSITGFGQTGPYAGRAGYDLLVQAMSGLMSITGDREPMKVGVAVSDLFTGMYAVVSILAALRARDATGVGQHIDLALLDTQMAVLANQAMNYLVGGVLPQRTGNAHPNIVPYRDFAVRDGRIMLAVGNDGQFVALCEALELSEVARDARYADNRSRVRHRDLLEPMLAEAFAGCARDAILSELEKRGVPAGPINDLAEAFAFRHVVARGLVTQVQRGDATVPSVGFPARFSGFAFDDVKAPPRHAGRGYRARSYRAGRSERGRCRGVAGPRRYWLITVSMRAISSSESSANKLRFVVESVPLFCITSCTKSARRWSGMSTISRAARLAASKRSR